MDPFSKDEALAVLVKQFERRWGLTLVTFLPPPARDACVRLQKNIAHRLTGDRGSLFNPYVEFYHPTCLHCTHLTLRRSDPGGPVRLESFLQPGHKLDELFTCLRKAACQVSPFEVELRSLRIGYDRLALVLGGKCADALSTAARHQLLEILNEELIRICRLDSRAWDSDPTKFDQLHVCLGYLKRPLPAGYTATVDSILGCQFQRIRFELPELSLIHHRRRSLAAPHEGRFDFEFGREAPEINRESAGSLGLLDISTQ